MSFCLLPFSPSTLTFSSNHSGACAQTLLLIAYGMLFYWAHPPHGPLDDLQISAVKNKGALNIPIHIH